MYPMNFEPALACARSILPYFLCKLMQHDYHHCGLTIKPFSAFCRKRMINSVMIYYPLLHIQVVMAGIALENRKLAFPSSKSTCFFICSNHLNMHCQSALKRNTFF